MYVNTLDKPRLYIGYLPYILGNLLALLVEKSLSWLVDHPVDIVIKLKI
jgi:hypothetical protein